MTRERMTRAAIVTHAVEALGMHLVHLECQAPDRARGLARQVCAHPDLWSCVIVYLAALAAGDMHLTGPSVAMRVHPDGTATPVEPADVGPYTFGRLLTLMATDQPAQAVDMVTEFYGTQPPELRAELFDNVLLAAHQQLHSKPPR